MTAADRRSQPSKRRRHRSPNPGPASGMTSNARSCTTSTTPRSASAAAGSSSRGVEPTCRSSLRPRAGARPARARSNPDTCSVRFGNRGMPAATRPMPRDELGHRHRVRQVLEHPPGVVTHARGFGIAGRPSVDRDPHGRSIAARGRTHAGGRRGTSGRAVASRRGPDPYSVMTRLAPYPSIAVPLARLRREGEPSDSRTDPGAVVASPHLRRSPGRARDRRPAPIRHHRVPRRRPDVPIFTPNPEILLRARSDAAYADVLRSADLALPDGTGVTLVQTLRDGELAALAGRRHRGVPRQARGRARRDRGVRRRRPDVAERAAARWRTPSA